MKHEEMKRSAARGDRQDRTGNAPDSAVPSGSARLLKIGLGASLMAAGLAVTVLLFIPWRRAKETHAWTKTPCVIVESYAREVQSGDLTHTTHRVFLRYRYSLGGKEYTGTKWRRITYAGEEDESLSRKTPHASEAEKLVEKYPAGTATVCWVNPGAPEEAVLEHQTTAAIYTLWWPMLFAVGGAGIVWSALRRKSLRGRYGPAVAPVPGFGGEKDRDESDDGES
jgi:hypothetical protein